MSMALPFGPQFRLRELSGSRGCGHQLSGGEQWRPGRSDIKLHPEGWPALHRHLPSHSRQRWPSHIWPVVLPVSSGLANACEWTDTRSPRLSQALGGKGSNPAFPSPQEGCDGSYQLDDTQDYIDTMPKSLAIKRIRRIPTSAASTIHTG